MHTVLYIYMQRCVQTCTLKNKKYNKKHFFYTKNQTSILEMQHLEMINFLSLSPCLPLLKHFIPFPAVVSPSSECCLEAWGHRLYTLPNHEPGLSWYTCRWQKIQSKYHQVVRGSWIGNGGVFIRGEREGVSFWSIYGLILYLSIYFYDMAN